MTPTVQVGCTGVSVGLRDAMYWSRCLHVNTQLAELRGLSHLVTKEYGATSVRITHVQSVEVIRYFMGSII